MSNLLADGSITLRDVHRAAVALKAVAVYAAFVREGCSIS
jgi:hypothetical protein